MDGEGWDAERDGPLSERALRAKLEDRGYRVARYVYPPGTFFPDHRHDDEPVVSLDATREGP